MKVLVKISGSLTREKKFYDWLSGLLGSLDKPFRLFVVCGGGERISQVLEEKGILYKFGPRGREISSLEGRVLARQVLEEEKNFVTAKLAETGMKSVVLIPVNKITGEHINGDEYALNISPKFDKICIVTLQGRNKAALEGLSGVEVVYL